MSTRADLLLLASLLAASLAPGSASAGPASRRPAAPAATTVTDVSQHIDVNNLDMVLTNLGGFAYDMSGSSAWGLVYPRGANSGVVFASGLWLGASVGGTPRVTVAEYSQEYQPGAAPSGVPENPSLAGLHVFKLHRTYATTSERDAALADYDANALPRGAPAVTVLGDGSLAIYGDEMCWSVCNDLSAAAHTNPAGDTAPLQVEVQQTTWAYEHQGPIGNTVFVRFNITNRGPSTLADMHLSFWADPDLGGYSDDLVGCDSTSSLGYCYNATNNDFVFPGAPPAVGYCLLQGPLGSTPGVRLPLTAFTAYVNGTDPTSASQSFQSMHGLDLLGNPIVDPQSNPTRFMYAGNPVTSTGWLDPVASDKRMLLSTGPITMSPGAVQEVVLAVIVSRGTDRLDSVRQLFLDTQVIRTAFANNTLGLLGVPRPSGARLAIDRTWPNPARRGCTVSFSLASRARASLELLDLAGRRVVNRSLGELEPGPHTLTLERETASLAPGIYFLRLAQDGISVRQRMVFLR